LEICRDIHFPRLRVSHKTSINLTTSISNVINEANSVWWHKLIRDWTKRDYAFFSFFTWILVFSLLASVRLIEGRAIDIVFTIVLSFALIPFELLITAAFQKYSSNTKQISWYSALLPTDFAGTNLLKNEKCLVFFYAEWCPFCRKSYHLLKSFDNSQTTVFRVDLSDENNPLWDSLEINMVPTLIAFKDGTEFWRADGISMVGLRKKDFEQAIIVTRVTDPMS
jgi:thiol-disulfide isomerase/thioredoxin